MTDVIEAMCRAYWNARGSVKWEKEPECQKALVRERMRAAVAAAENLQPIPVPAPVSDPNPASFSNLSDHFTDENTFESIV